ncbi:hypothetical protein R2Q81_07110 [Microbacterium aquimaris]|uniref:hypothetical protein n=1 Tax=Microbacterium aquimaris TaxID=459816 RepID=UPI002AD37303|nr:hypothetical protein [Microbacterium aquimaris]MDZ8275718.1 hypothetical protein [Microbacterium aquimaris]
MADAESFIVDNTSEDWKALNYVREWCDISDAIDIATRARLRPFARVGAAHPRERSQP